jgi:low affinity Fe/Cu permease
MQRSSGQWSSLFDRGAIAAAHATGTSGAFALAALVVVGWAASGPWFGYSETWQLVINTGTTIITFLMVFLIQHAQNKDSIALHLKLNELLASQPRASNRLIGAEELDEYALDRLKQHYQRLIDLESATQNVDSSHSTEQAVRRHHHKQNRPSD